jgi:hypothetical protein
MKRATREHPAVPKLLHRPCTVKLLSALQLGLTTHIGAWNPKGPASKPFGRIARANDGGGANSDFRFARRPMVSAVPAVLYAETKGR